MLARYFDMPFRKDVIQRIIEDQLQRNTASEEGEQTIGLIQIAAVADLIGLRATQVNCSDKQVERLQLPAIAFQQNKPIIIWSADIAGQALISSPDKARKQLH